VRTLFNTPLCGGGHGLGWAVEPRKEEEEVKGTLTKFCITTIMHRK
jgi:hypothetical protein